MQHIGTYNSGQKGPLVVVLGAIHGNEPVGVHAIEQILQQLQTNQTPFHGAFLGLLANAKAYKQQKRYIDYDMNRIWSTRFLDNPSFQQFYEIQAAQSLIQLLRQEIRSEQFSSMVLIDVHTTSATGASFVVPGKDPTIYNLMSGIQLPVVEGLLDYLSHTTLHYFDRIFQGKPCVSVGLEAGSHQSNESVHTAVSFIYHILSALECIPIVEKQAGLSSYPIYQLHSIQKIENEGSFEMLPGFSNFQRIEKGEALARYEKDILRSPIDGFILMPLYQKQGNEGYFLLTAKATAANQTET